VSTTPVAHSIPRAASGPASSPASSTLSTGSIGLDQPLAPSSPSSSTNSSRSSSTRLPTPVKTTTKRTWRSRRSCRKRSCRKKAQAWTWKPVLLRGRWLGERRVSTLDLRLKKVEKERGSVGKINDGRMIVNDDQTEYYNASYSDDRTTDDWERGFLLPPDSWVLGVCFLSFFSVNWTCRFLPGPARGKILSPVLLHEARVHFT